MSGGKRVLLLLAAFALSLLGARGAYACSCMRTQTVLDSYEWSDVVVVARAVSQETAPKKKEPKPDEGTAEKADGQPAEPEAGAQAGGPAEERRAGYGGVVSTKMVVERVYKGWLKPGEEMDFMQGGGGDCVWTFDKDDVGRSFLFYVKGSKGDAAWAAGTCGRSRPAEHAHDDLLYLDKLDKARGRTRISGTVRFDHAAAEHPSVEGLKLRFVGAGKTFNVRTNEHGVYEIYDAPAGRYAAEVEVPPGWKMAHYWLGYSPSVADLPEDERAPKKVAVIIEAKKHAALDILFEIDNAVAGRVFDTSGRPMDGVCLELLPARGEIPKGYYEGDCTERGGRFRFEEVKPGDYVLVVNRDGNVTSVTPFGTFYYPNAARREDATVFHVGLGDRVENLQVYVPKMEETITVEGAFLYSDGKPVAGESVEFEPEGAAEEGDPAGVRVETDAKGRFMMRILKGRRGVLFGRMYTYVGEFENCPRLDSAVRQTGGTRALLKTPAVEVQGVGSLYGVELRYPFPGCKKSGRE